MAKDDFHVIVYQILSYLYQCLKKGIDPEEQYLTNKGKLFHINYVYWSNIMMMLYEEGYIKGIDFERNIAEDCFEVNDLECCKITMKGIEYLADNSFMSKAKEFFKDVKSMTPFI